MTTTRKKYNKWKLRKKAFKKLKEIGKYEIYVHYKRSDLDGNNIEEIPDWIRELKKLEVLYLNNNNIQQIPTETLKECDSLHTVFLERNPIPQKEIERAKKELNVDILH